MASSGVVEVVLVAQDLAAYGRDIDAPGGLPELLEFLSDLSDIRWLRLLYLHPREISDRLLEVMVSIPQVTPYFDLSLQHASGRLLRAMKRPGNVDKHLGLVERIRSLSPEAALRSSFIVGFPDETDSDLGMLADFLIEASLDWAGFFPFSPEPGTPAAEMDGRVPREVVMERLRHLTEIQNELTAGANAEWIGETGFVLVDQVEEGVPVGRTYRHAPEIDGVVRLDSGAPGQWLEVEFTAAFGHDMEAVVT